MIRMNDGTPIINAYCPRCKAAQLHFILPTGPACKTCLNKGFLVLAPRTFRKEAQ